MISDREVKYILAGRRRARTDLVWLSRYILGMDKIVPHVHDPIVATLQQFPLQGQDTVTRDGFYEYVPPNPDPIKVYPNGDKRRLILAPRGWYKTSLNVIGHSIQTILNFPDVTISAIHASQEVVEKMLVNIKWQFQSNNTMRYFFPEFCPPQRAKEWGTQQFFQCPARKHFTTAPTFSVAGIESVRTGMHYHIIKFTDIVDEKNTATKDQCEKIIYAYGMCRNLLIGPKYWIDMEGTRYHFSDLYGRIIDDWMNEEKTSQEHKYKVFIMGCYKKDLKGAAEKFTPDELDSPYFLTDKNEKESRFPEEFPTDKLEEMRTDPVTGEDTFNTQQLNNPIGTEDTVFNPKDMRWKTSEELNRIPMQYHIVTIDTADTTNKRSNHTALTTCAVDRTNRRYVVDIQWGKFLPDRIVDLIFALQFKYRPLKIKIEETAFVRGLMPSIKRRSQELNIWPNFEFIQRDTQIAKQERIMSLQPWYKSGLIFFSTEIPDYIKEQLKHELTRFPKYTHDDILDTLADQFQNESVFGDLKPAPNMTELLLRAKRIMFANVHNYEEIFGEKKESQSWSGLGL